MEDLGPAYSTQRPRADFVLLPMYTLVMYLWYLGMWSACRNTLRCRHRGWKQDALGGNFSPLSGIEVDVCGGFPLWPAVFLNATSFPFFSACKLSYLILNLTTNGILT